MYIVTDRVTYTDIDSDMVHTYIVYVVVIDRQFAHCIIQYSVFIDVVCYDIFLSNYIDRQKKKPPHDQSNIQWTLCLKTTFVPNTGNL